MSTRTTRRDVLLGASLAGVGGVLAGCSTKAVPYDANEAGSPPADGTTPSASMAATAGSQSATGSNATGTSAGATGKVLSAAKKIPVGGGVIFTAEKVVVTQPTEGKFHAFSAVCTHVGCIVNQISNGTIDCPCHGSQFKITDGSVVAGPAPAPLPKKKIKVVKGKVHLV